MLNLDQTLKISESLFSPSQQGDLLRAVMTVVLTEGGGQKAGLVWNVAGSLRVMAIARAATPPSITCYDTAPLPLTDCPDLPLSLIEQVWTSQQVTIASEGASIYCAPLNRQNIPLGVLYVELANSEGREGIEEEHLRLITQQSAIALSRNHSAPTTSQSAPTPTSSSDTDTLKRTQNQLMQSAKMSMLGHLVGGVTHEINNSVNFISGNLVYAKEYLEQLVEIVNAYQENYPEPAADVEDLIEEYDLEFLLEDLPKLLNSMQTGASRMQSILLSLSNFARADESDIKDVNIHDIVDSLEVILHNQLKAKGAELEIEVVKNYGDIPITQGYPGQLNQVLMNLFSNAIDALTTVRLGQTDRKPTITITTEKTQSNQIKITFSDTGDGIPEDILPQIFQPFFTTKSSEQGTGLGLSMSQEIITQNHKGTLTCESQIGQGTTFFIEIPIRY
ncbi:HAMP domain-containing histidine kinase [Spirulina subsalsa FACHB-351]|uniref:histidine kinase n=1 Tax=Spirulina subsalsa FACHB-351 TaxID=234711 RepID=A0ABT3L1Z8_9CYAN|nr:HAMP domain-containing sensor histidine kinase [Spirulina subsalsa]MCW6035217.1 HAMP domain-containing histidine kinase [Spirulina subsalsa FACHB-351]